MTVSNSSTVRLDPADNVVVASRKLAPGDRAEATTVGDEIPVGHKVAVKLIKKGRGGY